MESLLGLLRIHMKRGVKLAIRDSKSSDPYVVVKMGKQVILGFSFFIYVSIICNGLKKLCFEEGLVICGFFEWSQLFMFFYFFFLCDFSYWTLWSVI